MDREIFLNADNSGNFFFNTDWYPQLVR